MNLPFNTGNDRPGFAEVDVGVARVMGTDVKIET